MDGDLTLVVGEIMRPPRGVPMLLGEERKREEVEVVDGGGG